MVSKVTYKLRLDELIDTTGLSSENKLEIIDRVGEYLYDKILEDTSEGRSAVTGQRWKPLSKKYKEYKSELANPEANLELTGDMLGELEYQTYRDGVEIGIFDNEQAQKADNHCKFSAKSKKTFLPPREFIPTKDKSFRSGIIKELVELAEDLKDEV